MTYTINVLYEEDLIVLNPPQNLEITSGYFFKYQMEKRIFWDLEQSHIVIWATLPGYHYTDPHLPTWLHFDQENFTFTGIPPVTSTQYNFTLDIIGVDNFGNTVNTTLTIIVDPNAACTAKYDNLNITCKEGQFCSFTVIDDYFIEPNDEELVYSLDSVSNNSWSSWSDMNSTIFGVPSSSGNITAVVRATDEAGLYCTTEILIQIDKSAGKWPE